MRVEVNGIRLFYDTEGAKLVPEGPAMRQRPTLLLLHGGPGMDGSYWRPWAAPLADVCQVIYLDQRGCGRSDPGPVAGWTLAQWGDDIRAFCDALEIEKPIVCGSSFGGEVAMSYATRHPDHPSKLALLSCSPRLDAGRIGRVFERLSGKREREIAERFWTAFDMSTAAEYVERCIPLYTRLPADPHHQARAVTSAEVTLEFLKPGGVAQQINLTASLAQIRCPTLVMGGEDDPVTPIEDMADIATAIPAQYVRFERIPDCGHGPFFDAPERSLEVLRDFIAS